MGWTDSTQGEDKNSNNYEAIYSTVSSILNVLSLPWVQIFSTESCSTSNFYSEKNILKL